MLPAAPSNVKIAPLQSIYNVGDELTCTADGIPPPTYRWKDLTTGILFQVQELTIKKSFMTRDEVHLECTATNGIAGFVSTTSRNITFRVEFLGERV